MTTDCITTTTEITTTNTAAALLSDTLLHAWDAIRGGYVMSGGMDQLRAL